MTTLWLRFPDESILNRDSTQAARERLEAVFSTRQPSPFLKALARLGMPAPVPGTRMLAWREAKPYYNGSALTQAVSGGLLRALPARDGGYACVPAISLGGLAGILRVYWRLARFDEEAESTAADPLEQSLALGLAMQAYMLRLGAKAPMLARWLAHPQETPARLRGIVTVLQTLQLRRTALSFAWEPVLGPLLPDAGKADSGPAFFWDGDTPRKNVQKEPAEPARTVCAGAVAGLAIAPSVETDPGRLAAIAQRFNAPLILVFDQASPQTTRLFPLAAGLVFCRGGVLSHACTVAREAGIPAMTGADPALYERLRASPEGLWAALDADAATLTFL